MNQTVREVQKRMLLRHVRSEPSRVSLRSASHMSCAPRYPTMSSLTVLQKSLSGASQNPNIHPISQFSSVAALPDIDSTPKKKKTNRNRDPITVTPAAASRIYFLISNHNQTRNADRAIGIRLGTKKRGCNGLSYTLDYAYENHAQNHKRDEGMEILFDNVDTPGHGLKVFIEPMALMNVIGTKMDFVDDEMSSEFTFTNPNSKGECGCGESFNV